MLSSRTLHVDRIFLSLVGVLLLAGFFIFISASLGLLARGGTIFSDVTVKHLLYAVLVGIPALFLGMRIPHQQLRRAALPLFVIALIATTLVFLPQIGVRAGGARRWVDIFGLSFQPAELLKLGFILYLSLWYANIRERTKTIRYGIVPLLLILGIPSVLLVLQPDNGTVLVLLTTAIAIFFSAGGRPRHFLALSIGLLLVFSAVAYTKPYVRNRVMTFLDPNQDPLGASYQVRQALIAVGSGEILGRGFGQSVQKFNYLPEPVSDSIFAVTAEEFGFVGSTILLLLFVGFALRGLWLAARAPDIFTRLLTVGLVILIVSQSFINIGAMLGLLPISGMPLIFVSQGGTALVFALFEVGIILGISKHKTEGLS